MYQISILMLYILSHHQPLFKDIMLSLLVQQLNVAVQLTAYNKKKTICQTIVAHKRLLTINRPVLTG